MKFQQIKDKIVSTLSSTIRSLKAFSKKNIQTGENKIASYVVLILIGSIIVFYLVFTLIASETTPNTKDIQVQNTPTQEKNDYTPNVDERQLVSKNLINPAPSGELSEMIQKANILYNNGRVEDALEIFDKLALYSQSLANYNLGVIKISEGQYKQAEEIFQKAINGGDDVAISALNAAYVAYKIKNHKDFSHYLNLANSQLYNSANTPFYSYLYGVVSYYKKDYFESLSPLLNPNSSDYQKQNDRLASKVFLMFNDDYNALEHLKKSATDEDYLALGMLYARNGEYNQAKNSINEFLRTHPNNPEATNALELVELKLRNYDESAKLLEMFSKEKAPKMPFKIITGLNEDLFDINIAQQSFWNRKFEHRQSLQYKILFYYAPYKVFDSKEVFQILSEGDFELGAGRIDESQDSYMRSQTISKINRDIANGLKEVYVGDLRKALKIFLENVKTYSQHSVLYYDIGLIYAQLGDFEKAYSYFSRAYHLNNKDILAGIFAMMSGQLVYQDTSRIASSIGLDFLNATFRSDRERMFMTELFEYARGGIPTLINVESEVQNDKSLYYAYGSIGAMANADREKIVFYFEKLREMQPQDLATNILYEVAKNFGKNLKEVSLKFSKTFRKGSFSNLHALYYGGALVRELYIYLAFVTGNLPYVINQLQEKLISEEASPNGTMQALGLAYIYNKNFEKAFATYNSLIDGLKEDDVRTKFLGAVSAIGAGHYNNAVVLLQISKLDSVASLESRYALGLLYQQTGNIKSAMNLFNGIANRGFVSEFFDFKIDTSELLEQ